MKVGLFVPCYIDQFYPEVAINTLELLEKLGLEVIVPEGQTCCGQPMANAGYENKAINTYQHVVHLFKGVDYIVVPSGSCAYHIKQHFDIIPQTTEVKNLRENVYELCEFLSKVIQLDAEKLNAHFPHKVGLHVGCHGLRGLRTGSCSEQMVPPYSFPEKLLELVDGLELVPLDRSDECCGFGGSFSMDEKAVSIQMGKDKVNDHLKNGAEVIVSPDMSCLMHLEGINKKQQNDLKVMHIAEILNQV